MADRYWVGGTATWDATAGTKWATTSGGAGGASVPTNSDNVFFDANSGVVTVTLSSCTCKDLNCTGFTGTITGTVGIAVYGSMTLSTSMTWSATGTMGFYYGNGVNNTVDSAGKTFGAVIFGLAINSTGSCTLTSAMTVTGTVQVLGGTLNTNGYTLSATRFYYNYDLTRVVNLGNSTLNLSSTGTTIPFDIYNSSTYTTFNAGTSTINLTGTSSYVQLYAQNKTLYNVSVSVVDYAVYLYASQYNDLTFQSRTNSAVAQYVTLYATNLNYASTPVTIAGTLTMPVGSDVMCRRALLPYAVGASLVINAFSGGNVDFGGWTVTGAGAPISGTSMGDLGGNSGITFTTPKTVYWNLAGTQNWNAIAWCSSSGGTPAVSNYPLAQDTAVFDNAGSAGTVTLATTSVIAISTVDCSTRTAAITFSGTGYVYGSWTNGSGVTVSGSTLYFRSGNNVTLNSAGKTHGTIYYYSYSGGSLTLTSSLTLSNLYLYGGGSTFNTDGYTITVSSTFSANDNGTSARQRYMNMKSGALYFGNVQIVTDYLLKWGYNGTIYMTYTAAGYREIISQNGSGADDSLPNFVFTPGALNHYIYVGVLNANYPVKFRSFAYSTNIASSQSIRFQNAGTFYVDYFNVAGFPAAGARLTIQSGSGAAPNATLIGKRQWIIGSTSILGVQTNFVARDPGAISRYLYINYITGKVANADNVFMGV